MKFFVQGGLENGIFLYRWSRKCHFVVQGVSKMPFCCIGVSQKCHFFVQGISKIGKISSPLPIFKWMIPNSNDKILPTINFLPHFYTKKSAFLSPLIQQNGIFETPLYQKAAFLIIFDVHPLPILNGITLNCYHTYHMAINMDIIGTYQTKCSWVNHLSVFACVCQSVYQFSELTNNHKFLGNQSRYAVAVLGRS